MSQPGGRDRRANTVSSTTTTHGPTITTTTYTGNGRRTRVTTSAPHTGTISSPTVTTTHQIPLSQTPRSSAGTQIDRQPSIRIRHAASDANLQSDDADTQGNRRRSFSEPERPQPALLKEVDDSELRRHASAAPLQTLHEEGSGYSAPQVGYYTPVIPERSPRRPAFGRQASAISLRHARNFPAGNYDADVVDVLDVIGMEVLNPCVDSTDFLRRSRSLYAHNLE